MTKVWLVWTGSYSDKTVVGVYSSLELATAAANLYGAEGYVDETDGYTVDGDEPLIRAGVSRWGVWMRLHDGHVLSNDRLGLATGTPTEVRHHDYSEPTQLVVLCDAKTEEVALKIAVDERAQFLVTGQEKDNSEYRQRTNA